MKPLQRDMSDQSIPKATPELEGSCAPSEAEPSTASRPHAQGEAETVLEQLKHNQQLPVNSLPPEVLSAIFLSVAGFYLGHYTRLLRLRVVCKYWKEVIDSTTELWTPIKSQLDPELQAMIIRNSGNQLLSVEYDETIWEKDPAKEAKMAAFSSLMESSASRWRDLEYKRGLDSENDIWILSLPLHNLRAIRFDAPTWRDRRLTLDAPKLSHVDATRLSLNWRSLSGLQYLYLALTTPTLNELMAMLRASPNLRHLFLNEAGLKIEPEATVDSSKIFLPHLFRLIIYRAPRKSICFLLDSIETSGLETFSVTVQFEYESEDCTSLCESAGRYIGAFPLPQDEKQGLVTITAWRREVTFALGGRRIVIRDYTWAGNSGAQDRLACFGSTIKSLDSRVGEEVKILDLRCAENGEAGEYLRTVHLRFPQIDQIRLMRAITDIPAVFQHLGSPLQSESAEGWLLPKLTKLELDLSRAPDAALIDSIVQLITQRKLAVGVAEVTQLRIACVPRAIGPAMVELLHQSVASFELTEKQEG